MKVASLFSGAMGLDVGMERHGFETVLAVESDPHAQATIRANRPGLPIIGDVFDPSLVDAIKAANVDVICGGPPCQTWSHAGKREGLDDERGMCIPRFIDVIREARPRLAVMENVPGLMTAEVDGVKGGMIQYVERRLRNAGYGVTTALVNAVDFGVPQSRQRVILLCLLNGTAPSLEKTHGVADLFEDPEPWLTLKDAIGDRPKGEGLEYPESKLQFFRMLKAGQDWRDLPEELQREAMKGAMDSEGGRTGFFRRLSWDKPCPTLTCSPVGKANAFCHPDEDRPLNVVEYARIQQFPDDWKFEGPLAERYRQIGNAIPIGLAEAIGKALKGT